MEEPVQAFAFCFSLVVFSMYHHCFGQTSKRIDNQTTEGEGIDIVLCMDVSGSMGSRDVAPSRMDAAKEVAEEFIRSRPVDRIGLVVFSGESFTQCPVTGDHQSLITHVQSLESRKHLIDGTVIGEGLATAVDRLSKVRGRAVLLFCLPMEKKIPGNKVNRSADRTGNSKNERGKSLCYRC